MAGAKSQCTEISVLRAVTTGNTYENPFVRSLGNEGFEFVVFALSFAGLRFPYGVAVSALEDGGKCVATKFKSSVGDDDIGGCDWLNLSKPFTY